MARNGLLLMMLTVVLACLNAELTVLNLVSQADILQKISILGGLARTGAAVAGLAGSLMCLAVPHEVRARSAALVAAAFFMLAFLLGAIHLEGRWPDLLILGALAIFLRYVHHLARFLDHHEVASTVYQTLAWPVFGVVCVIGAIPLGLVFGPWAMLGPLTALGFFALGAFRYARTLNLLAAAVNGKLLTPAAAL